MADNSEAIQTNSQSPKSASGDGHSVEAHSIPDQILADKYAKNEAAVTNGPGVRNRKFRHKGPVF